MKKYLLDTNVIIEFFRGNQSVIDKISEVGTANCYISEITIAELFYGASKSQNPKHYDDVNRILRLYEVVPIYPSLELYGKCKASLELKGIKVSEFDLLIGCSSIFGDFVMVTGNIKHFSHIPGISLQNWN